MKQMRYSLGLILLTGMVSPVLAFQPVSGPLPMFAQSPEMGVSVESPWKGFYSGSDFSFMGGTGLRGQEAGSSYFGYKHTFKNKVFADIQTRSGYQPLLGGRSVVGYGFTSMRLKAGYDLGRFRPFIGTSFAVTSPERMDALTFSPFGGAPAGLNSAAVGARSFATVSAGFDYKITNNLSFSAAVSVGSNSGSVAPRW